MADPSQSPAEGDAGQLSADPGTTNPDPGAANPNPDYKSGQATDADPGKTNPDPGKPAVDTFFDPSALPEELKQPYGQMQAAFTKKMQKLSESREKVEAYDAFMADPTREIQRLA